MTVKLELGEGGIVVFDGGVRRFQRKEAHGCQGQGSTWVGAGWEWLDWDWVRACYAVV